MIERDIVIIDEDKCDGCGICAPACAEGAIAIVDGKAKLIGENLCDGLGDCIGECPRGALRIERRQAVPFDEEAVLTHLGRGCPLGGLGDNMEERSQWPVQLALVPDRASYFNERELLVVADCVPVVHPTFHQDFLGSKGVVIGCPKLDDSAFYLEKLGRIAAGNALIGITVVRMDIPCCRGLVQIAKGALRHGGKDLPLREIAIDGKGRRRDF